MYISITFPFADFRSLHRDNAGRLERPAWGMADPQAKFVRGFGSIHTRTKPGGRFAGENYYADCNNLIRYPAQYCLYLTSDLRRFVRPYPFYRRFYFDGQMAGRFELGFRLNEGTLNKIQVMEGKVEYSASEVALQFLKSNIRVKLLDDREILQPFFRAVNALRDGWLLSSTKSSLLKTFDIESVGANYVGVGHPFVFIRTGHNTMVGEERQSRVLLKNPGFEFFVTRSGVHHQNFDTAVISSKGKFDDETAKERLARLYYSQIRTLAFAHSFYLRQVSLGKIEAPKVLESAIRSLLDRLKNLQPVEDQGDEIVCSELRELLQNADIDPVRLAREIEEQVRPGLVRRNLGSFLSYFDRKTNIAIEAAASTATTRLFSGGL